jgi:hypothetical protein
LSALQLVGSEASVADLSQRPVIGLQFCDTLKDLSATNTGHESVNGTGLLSKKTGYQ